MTDVQLFGLNAGRHHLTSLFFHIANTILLFLILNRITGARWRSAFVAKLFALHPLHVESVAWVADRKDLLCAFFWFLTIWVCARYAEHPGILRYALVFLLFLVALTVKSMAITLPLSFLLMGDRYTYISLIGLFIIIAWGVPDMLAGWQHRKLVLTTGAVLIIAGLMAASWRQLSYWENTAHTNLASILRQLGKLEEAIVH